MGIIDLTTKAGKGDVSMLFSKLNKIDKNAICLTMFDKKILLKFT